MRNKDFILVNISIHVRNCVQNHAVNTTTNNKQKNYKNHFTALPRGKLVYPSAEPVRIPGLQTAIVTGPKEQDIYMDNAGRIKVQFHWDRVGQKNENSSFCARLCSDQRWRILLASAAMSFGWS